MDGRLGPPPADVRGGLAWTLIKVVMAGAGVLLFWYATRPFVYAGLVDSTLDTWVYSWLAGWTVATALVGGVLEGLVAGIGLRRVGAVAWVPVGALAMYPFAFVTGHWGVGEPAWTRTSGQLLTTSTFWVVMCVGQFLLARKIAVWWQATSSS